MQHRGMNTWGHMSTGSNIVGIMLILITVIIIIGIFLVIKTLKNGKNNEDIIQTSQQKSLSILSERYAKGEINEEEYKRMRQVLEENK